MDTLESASPQTCEDPRPDWLTHASALMPWAMSILFHVGLLLIMMFLTILVLQPAALADPPPDVSGMFEPNPGAHQEKSPTERAEREDPVRPEIDTPALDVMEQIHNRQAGEPIIGLIGDVGPSRGGVRGTDLLPSRPGGTDEPDGFLKFYLPDGNGPLKAVVFVIDSSGSMFETFSYVQAELKRRIDELDAEQTFHVVFFADDTPFEMSIDGRVRLTYAVSQTKAAAADWINRQIAESKSGRTDPRKALDKAFKVAGGPPDQIVLLTDGLFPAETLATLAQLNPGRKVSVNTVAFRSRVGEPLLRKIAEENRGRCIFVSDSELGR